MASGKRPTALPRDDVTAAQASVEQAAVAETQLDTELSGYEDDLQRVRGAIAENAETVNHLNRGVSVAATKKKSAPAKRAPAKKATAKKVPSKRAPAKTTATANGKNASSKSAVRTSAPTKPETTKPTRKKAATTKAASGKSAAGKSLPTKKQIGEARVVLTEVRAQEKKLTKKLDRHTANLRDLKHDLKTSEKDLTKVEAKLDQSKRSRQRAQKKLKNLQS